MLVTVATFTEPWEAHLFRGRLLAEDIFAVVSHEHHVGQNWPYALALGGAKVQVRRTDRERALEIDRQCRTGNLQAELAATYPDFGASPWPCPSCGSTRIVNRRSAPMVMALLAAVYLTGLIFPLRPSVHRCLACGSKWSDRSASQGAPTS